MARQEWRLLCYSGAFPQVARSNSNSELLTLINLLSPRSLITKTLKPRQQAQETRARLARARARAILAQSHKAQSTTKATNNQLRASYFGTSKAQPKHQATNNHQLTPLLGSLLGSLLPRAPGLSRVIDRNPDKYNSPLRREENMFHMHDGSPAP